MEDLKVIRSRIDEIDNQLVELFEKRLYLCQDVAAYKCSVGKPVFDKQREKD